MGDKWGGSTQRYLYYHTAGILKKMLSEDYFTLNHYGNFTSKYKRLYGMTMKEISLKLNIPLSKIAYLHYKKELVKMLTLKKSLTRAI